MDAGRVEYLTATSGRYARSFGAGSRRCLHRSLAFGGGEARISLVARLARNGTEIPRFGTANPAGGVQARAEPNVFYRGTGIPAFD